MQTIAIVGNSTRGKYGHHLDMAFVGVEGAEIIALADPDEKGRAAIAEKTGAKTAYADYREMLEKEKPDITVFASREIGDHFELVTSAQEIGSGTHIYLEKPIAATPAEVDQMVAACEANDKLLILATPWRGHPPIQRTAIPLIKDGKIGEPRLARIHGRNGPHGGNQMFLDLYPHFFDFLEQVWGAPQWCSAHITVEGRDATPADLKEGVEGMGLVAGNGIRAYYQFDDFAADFEAYEGDHNQPLPYRVDIHGTSGTISLPGPMSNQPDIYFHPHVAPELHSDEHWEVIPSDPPPDDKKWVNAHHRMAKSMIDRIEGREPEFALLEGSVARTHVTWAMAAHASHIAGARVALPLNTDQNPFENWT
jgi:predicted dehydrogenase